MLQADFENTIRPNLPDGPGVYKFLDEEGKILYVGKAKSLKKRVSSYFIGKKNLPYKTTVMVRNARDIDCVLVETESDALLLENILIKKHQPRYNVNLKDAKTYTYICVKNERFPRVFFTRRVLRDGSQYFGPYTSKYKARIVLDLIKSLFPIRSCNYNLSEQNIKNGKFKVCLEYHIKNCEGPCEGLESEEAYEEKITQIKNMLKGQFSVVKNYWKSQMKDYVANLQFEKAQAIKEKLDAFEDYQGKSTVVNTRIRNVDVFSLEDDGQVAYVNYIRVVNGAIIYTNTVELTKNLNIDPKELLVFAIRDLRDKYNSNAPQVLVPFPVNLYDDDVEVIVPKIGDKRKLLELSEKNLKFYVLQKQRDIDQRKRRVGHAERILSTLKEDLQMEDIPLHIECFDNSNIQGKNPVASCVVFRNARPSKKEYRHYHIKTVKGPDDYASMGEVVYRRYNRLLEEEATLPQLIIIDGGKGQLNAAVNSLGKLGILEDLTVIGIAKRLEEIYFPGDPIPLHINKKSESLKLIQQARNEAHRFAINFHRQVRSKDFTQTELTGIPGIGQKTADSLLKHFGSVQKVREASDRELRGLIGRSKALKVAQYFERQSKQN